LPLNHQLTDRIPDTWTAAARARRRARAARRARLSPPAWRYHVRVGPSWSR